MTTTRATTAFLRARPDRADDLADLLLSVVGRARAEPGCLEFAVHRSVDDADLLVLYEVWRSADDLQRHLDQPYMASLAPTMAECLEKEPEVSALHLLSRRAQE